MALTVVGASHHTAPLDVRERFAHDVRDALDAAAALVRAGAREAVLLSTCNRTEFYLVDEEGTRAADALAVLSTRLGADASSYTYVRRGQEAAAHLFRVAAGMDSMVLGEAQIHGQVRDAWEHGRAHAGPVLNRLFQSALLVAGRVRSETALGRGAASVSSAAVQLAKQIFGSLVGRRAMVLGAGEMAELALESLASEGVRASIVANRALERAQALASRFGAVAVHWDECWSSLPLVDVLLCSTSAPHPVVGVPQLAPAARGGRPLCVLDVALPRDVDPAVRELETVYLYDLDDLQAVVGASLEARRAELPSAEQLIGGEVRRYWDWLAGLAAVPVLTEVRAEAERLRQREVAEALRRLGPATAEQRAAVEQLSRALMNKFLHAPTVRLRAAAAEGRGLAMAEAARYLFALDREAAPDDGAAGVRAPEHVPVPTHASGRAHDEEHE